jgi:anion-transporting  ArsA/GET3 family ATPase
VATIAQLAQQNEQFIALFIGKNGSGKTVAEASFARLGPLKLYDADMRSRGILGAAKTLGKEILERIEVFQPKIEEGWAGIDKEMEMDLIKQASGQFRFKTVVFDSLATMQKLFILDSQRLRGKGTGKMRGKIQFWTPDDYNYCSMAFAQFFYGYARKLKCNIIVSGWMVDRWGKQHKDGEEENPYAENEVIGQKIVLTEKLAEEVPGYFDEIYTFEKEESSVGSGIKYVVNFESTLAKTCHESLRAKKRMDFTNKVFYDEFKKLVENENQIFATPPVESK